MEDTGVLSAYNVRVSSSGGQVYSFPTSIPDPIRVDHRCCAFVHPPAMEVGSDGHPAFFAFNFRHRHPSNLDRVRGMFRPQSPSLVYESWMYPSFQNIPSNAHHPQVDLEASSIGSSGTRPLYQLMELSGIYWSIFADSTNAHRVH